MSGHDWVGSQGDAPPDGHQMSTPDHARVPRQPPLERPPFNPEALTFAQIASRARGDRGFREGLQVAAVVCRGAGDACPADMAASYVQALADGKTP